MVRRADQRRTEVTSPEDLLAGLDDQQRIAAESLLGPVCLLAGAGTGKTRAITHRVAYGVATGVYSPGRVMALTFTSRAAAELRTRLRALGAQGVAARTFHASALSQLNFFWPQVIGGTMPRLLDSKGRLLAHAAETLKLKLDTATLRDTAAEIEWRKVSRLSIEQYGRAAQSRALPPTLTVDKAVDLQRAYEAVKDERRQLDFEDVLLATAGMIESEPRVAQQVREQYRFFVVDEYQDVSPLQHELLGLWLGDRDDVCVVGDASQTIYSFAGATPEYLLGFAGTHQDAVVVRLEQNYRSTPAIIESANRLMRGRPGALSLHATPEAARGPMPATSTHKNDSQEARAIAQSIAAEIAEGTKPENIAILYRINVQSAALEAALGDAGVPYLVRGSTRFFDLKEVKEAIMMIKGASISITGEPIFKTVSDVLRSLGWTQRVDGSGRGGPRRHFAQGLRLRLARAPSWPARTHDVGRNPRDAPQREGTRMGQRLHRGGVGGAAADHVREGPRGHRRGTPPVLRRCHPRPPAALAILVRRGSPSWAGASGKSIPGRAALGTSRQPHCGWGSSSR
jgi:DNA helicase-2/ATP-dependent DNA helicase PcrA